MKAKEFSDFKNDYINECKECGVCFKNCYAFKKTKYPIFEHLKEFFEDHSHENKIKKFLNSCLYCKAHEEACIKGINLTLLIPVIKFELNKIDSRYTWVPPNVPSIGIKFIRSPRLYYFWRNFNKTLIPQEFRDKFEEYRKPQKRHVVFFSGCGIQLLENQYYILLEIFKKLNVNFGLIDGSYRKPVCCGAVHCEAGNFRHGTLLLKNLIREIKKFGTKKVIVYCATCYYGLVDLAPNLVDDFDFEVVHASGYLAEVLRNKKEKLLKAPESKKQVFTIHDSCHLARSGDTTSIRNLLSLLPGATISEMKHNKMKAFCDLYYVLVALKNPLSLVFRNDIIPIIDEAVDTQADVLCSLCPGCHALLTLFGSDVWTSFGYKEPRIPVKNWVSILGEYLGIRRKDMLIHRLSHIFSFPFKDSGIWYLWTAIKAMVRGYFGKKEPKFKN